MPVDCGVACRLPRTRGGVCVPLVLRFNRRLLARQRLVCGRSRIRTASGLRGTPSTDSDDAFSSVPFRAVPREHASLRVCRISGQGELSDSLSEFHRSARERVSLGPGSVSGLCIGEFPIRDGLGGICADHVARGRRVEVRWVRQDQKVRNCQILFVSQSEVKR